jgi:hypothetical protein
MEESNFKSDPNSKLHYYYTPLYEAFPKSFKIKTSEKRTMIENRTEFLNSLNQVLKVALCKFIKNENENTAPPSDNNNNVNKKLHSTLYTLTEIIVQNEFFSLFFNISKFEQNILEFFEIPIDDNDEQKNIKNKIELIHKLNSFICDSEEIDELLEEIQEDDVPTVSNNFQEKLGIFYPSILSVLNKTSNSEEMTLVMSLLNKYCSFFHYSSDLEKIPFIKNKKYYSFKRNSIDTIKDYLSVDYDKELKPRRKLLDHLIKYAKTYINGLNNNNNNNNNNVNNNDNDINDSSSTISKFSGFSNIDMEKKNKFKELIGHMSFNIITSLIKVLFPALDSYNNITQIILNDINSFKDLVLKVFFHIDSCYRPNWMIYCCLDTTKHWITQEVQNSINDLIERFLKNTSALYRTKDEIEYWLCLDSFRPDHSLNLTYNRTIFDNILKVFKSLDNYNDDNTNNKSKKNNNNNSTSIPIKCSLESSNFLDSDLFTNCHSFLVFYRTHFIFKTTKELKDMLTKEGISFTMKAGRLEFAKFTFEDNYTKLFLEIFKQCQVSEHKALLLRKQQEDITTSWHLQNLDSKDKNKKRKRKEKEKILEDEEDIVEKDGKGLVSANIVKKVDQKTYEVAKLAPKMQLSEGSDEWKPSTVSANNLAQLLCFRLFCNINEWLQEKYKNKLHRSIINIVPDDQIEDEEDIEDEENMEDEEGEELDEEGNVKKKKKPKKKKKKKPFTHEFVCNSLTHPSLARMMGNKQKESRSFSTKTKYKDIIFRSKLEATWALFFDLLEIKWLYEAKTVTLFDGTSYTIDFTLPDLNVYIEIKPKRPYEEEKSKAKKLSFSERKPIYILYGTVGIPFAYKGEVTENNTLLPNYKHSDNAIAFKYVYEQNSNENNNNNQENPYTEDNVNESGPHVWTECPFCSLVQLSLNGKIKNLPCKCISSPAFSKHINQVDYSVDYWRTQKLVEAFTSSTKYRDWQEIIE